MNDIDDLAFIDVEARLHERIADAERERLARSNGGQHPPRRAGARRGLGLRFDIRRRLGRRLIAVGTAILAASRLEAEAEDGRREAGGAA